MSEINSIANGSFVLGQTSATNFVAGPGIKIDEPSAGTVRIGNDETVLWEGTPSTSINLSEPFSNFENVKITAYAQEQTSGRAQVFEFIGTNPYFDLHIYDYNSNGTSITNYLTRYNINGTNVSASIINHWWQLTGSVTGGTWAGPGTSPVVPMKVIGINRISGSNA